ncbi:BNR repeat domain protein [Minicystis rosea]|nr:BNR repeat domain protein [Minicystis rosea]
MMRFARVHTALGALFLAAAACSSSTNDMTSTSSSTGDTSHGGAGGSATSSGGGNVASGGSAATGGSGPTSVTGISKVVTGEYVTSFLKDGRLYGIAGTLPRLGAGDHPPSKLFPPAEVAFSPDLKIVDAAGGLHVTIATDDKGHVWEWGDAPSNPALEKSNVPVQITPDSEGNEFTLRDDKGNNVLSMAASIVTSVAVKGDGSVWVWDDCSGGLQGDGTDGSKTVTHPIRVNIPLPAGVKITKVVVSEVVIALASDGTVWSWGGNGAIENLGTGNSDYKTPHQLTKTSDGKAMPPIVDIATGQSYSHALAADGALYTWGVYAEIAGLCPGSGWCPAKLPVLSTHVVLGENGGSGAHITSIYANTGASYAILSDGTLWAWGSNGQGLVGNGVEPDYSQTNPPYAWDWNKDSMLVTQAVHIAPDVHDFVNVFTGPADVFYTYAMTSNGRLFSWGRNKTANLGSGVYPQNSQQAATYPNSWDVTVPTEVSPMTAPNQPTPSPQCKNHPESNNCWCGSGPNDPQDC